MIEVFEIPTRPGRPQQQTISLDGVRYQLDLYWDVPASLWMLNIADLNGNPILSGLPLVTGVDLLEQYQHLNIGGALVVQSDFDWRTPPTFDNLGINGHLYFIPTAALAVAGLTVPLMPQSRTRAIAGVTLPQPTPPVPPPPPDGTLTASVVEAPPLTYVQTGISGHVNNAPAYPYFNAFAPVFVGIGSDITITLTGSYDAPAGAGTGTVETRIVEFPSGVSGPQTVLASQTLPLPAGGAFSLNYHTIRAAPATYHFGCSHQITGSWGGNLHESFVFTDELNSTDGGHDRVHRSHLARYPSLMEE